MVNEFRRVRLFKAHKILTHWTNFNQKDNIKKKNILVLLDQEIAATCKIKRNKKETKKRQEKCLKFIQKK